MFHCLLGLYFPRFELIDVCGFHVDWKCTGTPPYLNINKIHVSLGLRYYSRIFFKHFQNFNLQTLTGALMRACALCMSSFPSPQKILYETLVCVCVSLLPVMEKWEENLLHCLCMHVTSLCEDSMWTIFVLFKSNVIVKLE